MFDIDIKELFADRLRSLQLIAIAAAGVVGILAGLTEWGFFFFLFFLVLACASLVSLMPAFSRSLSADAAPLPKTGRTVLRAVEAAGLGGVGLVVMALVMAFTSLFGSWDEKGVATTMLIGTLIFAGQAVAGLAIAAGVGFTNLLRNEDVEIEAPPPPPQPKPAPAPPVMAAPAAPPAAPPAEAPAPPAPPAAPAAPAAEEAEGTGEKGSEG
jgi:hypothetical protein